MRLFSTEQVSKYHPDKYADQISDAILDACLKEDKNSRVACECIAKGSTVILCGEITTSAKVDYAAVAKRVGTKLGYPVETVITNITEQSPEIAGGVKTGDDLRAGDQGIMFGYACSDTEAMLPYGFAMANEIIKIIEDDAAKPDSPLKGDAKCQVTVDLDMPHDETSLVEILISVCHDQRYFRTVYEVEGYITRLLDNAGLNIGDDCVVTVNPAGKWTVGGPTADCGLTGRKIVCDQYGGYCPVGGGAFSGKDPSKVDRSAAYMARQIACDLLQAHDLGWCEVQLAYAIGEAKPISIIVDSPLQFRNSLYAEEVEKKYDLTPAGIIKYLDLLNVKYEELAEGCHFRKKIRRTADENCVR